MRWTCKPVIGPWVLFCLLHIMPPPNEVPPAFIRVPMDEDLLAMLAGLAGELDAKGGNPFPMALERVDLLMRLGGAA